MEQHQCCYKRMLMRLNSLRTESHFCDVDLEAGDSTMIYAHSIILSSWSNYLHNKITSTHAKGDPSARIHIKIPELMGDTLDIIVQFMYGQIPQEIEQVEKLKTGLNKFGINTSNTSVETGFDDVLVATVPLDSHLSECDHLSQTGDNTKDHHESNLFQRVTRRINTDKGTNCITSKPPSEKHESMLKTKSALCESIREEDTDTPSLVQVSNCKENEALTKPSKIEIKRDKYFCKKCQRQFKTLAFFVDHQHVHNQEKPFSCRICQKLFSYSKSLCRHEKKCKGPITPKSWTCDTCGGISETLKSYKVHIKTHQKEVFKCKDCKKHFFDEKRLESHIRSVHGPGNICVICGKHLQSQSGYEQHMKTHAEDFPLRCDVCNQGFHNQAHYEGHINKHNEQRPYICSKCGLSFGYQQALQTHEKRCSKMKTISQKQKVDPQCDICGLVFKNVHSLQGHKRGKHGNASHQCLICRQEFIWRQSYNRHKATCKGPSKPEEEEAKIYTCSHCDTRFRLQSSLKEHIQAKHEEPKFVCTDCPARFNWKSSYYRHRKTSHLDTRKSVKLHKQDNGSDDWVINKAIVERQEVVITECPPMETNLQLIGEYQPDIEQDMMAASTLLVGSDVPLLANVTEWQYTEAFTYQ